MLLNFCDFDIYLLYYLDIKSIFNLASISKDENALITSLDFVKELILLKRKYRYINTKNTIDYAATNNYISILKWFDRSNNDFIYTENAIDNASADGYIDIIKWFDESRHEFLYTTAAINLASAKAHIDILDWFDKSIYVFKYNKNAVYQACAYAHIGVLEWLDKSRYKFKYSKYAISAAASAGLNANALGTTPRDSRAVTASRLVVSTSSLNATGVVPATVRMPVRVSPVPAPDTTLVSSAFSMPYCISERRKVSRLAKSAKYLSGIDSLRWASTLTRSSISATV